MRLVLALLFSVTLSLVVVHNEAENAPKAPEEGDELPANNVRTPSEMSAPISFRQSFEPVLSPLPADSIFVPMYRNVVYGEVRSPPPKRMRLSYDVLIRVENKLFISDRATLSKHSLYFAAMFSSKLKESSMKEIRLEEYVDADTFEELTKFFYSGSESRLEINDGNVFRLLWTSSYLLISELTQHCVDHILRRRDSMKVDDVLKIFVFARRTNLVPLVDRLHGYVMQHFFDLSRSDTFLMLSFDEMIQLLTEYKSVVSSRSFNWKHGEIYSLIVLLEWVKRSVSGRRQRSEFEELMKMINFDDIPKEFAEFIKEKFKFRFPIWTEFRREFPRLESDLRKFIRDTEDIDDILPRYRRIDSAEMPPIHAFVQKPESMCVYSISRLQPFWSVSLTSAVPSEFHAPSKAPENGWMYQPFNSFQCFTLSDDCHSVYCLKNVKTSKGISQTFHVGSSLDIFGESSDLAPPPKFLTESDVCRVETDVYFYEPRKPYWGSYENRLSNSNLDYQKIKHDDITCYNSERDEWIRVPQPRTPQVNACMTADKNSVYLIGGWSNRRNCVQAYDGRESGWHYLSETAHVHKEAACCTLNGHVYVFNGSEIEKYVPAAGKWETVDLNEYYYLWSLGEPRRMLPYGNQLWFFTHFRNASSKVFIYDTVSGKSFVNTCLIGTIENDWKEEFSVRSVLVHAPTP